LAYGKYIIEPVKIPFIKNHKKISCVAVGVLIIALIVLWIGGRSTSTQSIVTEQVKTDNISLLVSASGNIIPKTSYSLMAKASSVVTAVNVKGGDRVNQGDALIKFDDTELQNSIKEATYNYYSAIYKRNQLKSATIVDSNSVGQAQQQVNLTYTQLQSAKNALSNATITAPIGGEVLTVNLKVGDYASPTLPAVIVADTTQFDAVINVNEIDINKVQPGQNVVLTVDALPNTITGIVTSIDSNGTNLLGIVTYQVHIKPNITQGLRPNMSVDADISIQERDSVLVIPAAAIQVVNGKSYAQIVASSNATASSAVKKEIQTGISNNAETEITSGLSAGEYVVVNIVNTTSASIFNFGR